MDEPQGLSCKEVGTHLKRFLEDLLSDDQHEVFLAHIDSCARCKMTVSGVGSFLNQIRELGKIKVPTDFSSAVLLRAKPIDKMALLEAMEKKRVSAASKAPLLAGIVVLAVTLGGAFLAVNFFIHKNQPQKIETMAPQAVRPSGEVKPEPSQAAETNLVPSAPAQKTSEVILAQKLEPGSKPGGVLTEKPSEGLSSQKIAASNLAAYPVHWHFFYAAEDAKDKFSEVLRGSGHPLEYETSDTLLMTLPDKEADQLLKKVQAISPDASRLDEFAPSKKGAQKGQPIRISIYLQKLDSPPTDSYHWHLIFSLPNRFKLSEILENSDVTIEKKFDELVVISLSVSKLQDLVQRIKGITGVSADFGHLDLSTKTMVSYQVQVSIFLMEG